MNALFTKSAFTLLLSLLLLKGFTQAPQAFSLSQAQEYAYKNNYDLKNSTTDIEIARKLVKQNTAIGLPQLNANIDYIDYLALPTSLIPGEFVGKPGTTFPIQFGSEYNATLKATLTQLIYSGQYLVGLQTAKAFLETVKQQNVKDKMDVRDVVSVLYLTALMYKEQTRIIDTLHKVTSQMVSELEATLKLGLIEDIDVEQIALNKSDLEAILINTSSSYDITIARLKYQVGLNGNQTILLTDSLGYFMSTLAKDYLMNQPFDINTNVDFELLKKREYQVYMQYKLSKAAYQPTLSGFLGASANAQRSGWTFFNDKYPWYGTANWGVSLQIPIWSSGNRKYTVDQAYLNWQKMKVNEEKTKTALDLQVAQTKSDFNNAYLVYLNKQKGLDLSTRIYVKTMKKYREGMSGSTELNQKYNQFLQSEKDYLLAMFSVLNLKVQLARLLEKV
ncbi:MAG: TolC family protein [Bacteroidota bacterium]